MTIRLTQSRMNAEASCEGGGSVGGLVECMPGSGGRWGVVDDPFERQVGVPPRR